MASVAHGGYPTALDDFAYLSHPHLAPPIDLARYRQQQEQQDQQDEYGQMNDNNDPGTDEFMYQVPSITRPQGAGIGQEGGLLQQQAGGTENVVDPTALSARLLALRHKGPDSSDSLLTSSQQSPEKPLYPSQGFLQPSQYPYHNFPSVTDLAPSDSVSKFNQGMYRPFRKPLPADPPDVQPSSPTSHGGGGGDGGRRGGTNMDGEAEGDGYDSGEQGRDLGEAMSYGTHGGVTMGSPGPDSPDIDQIDQMTAQPTSVWTAGTLAGNMYNMRDRLMNDAMARDNAQNIELSHQLSETAKLSSALAKLEMAEQQLRHLQATLIAERVAKSEMEREKCMSTDEMKECRNELASAVRALRRARDEGKKTDEERRRIQRAYEETTHRLHLYHEALEVRKAEEKGREEGRNAALAEIAQWMSVEGPPIPGMAPLQTIPHAVLQQTPGAQPALQLWPQQPPTQPQSQPQAQYSVPPPQQAPQQSFQPQHSFPIEPTYQQPPQQQQQQQQQYFSPQQPMPQQPIPHNVVSPAPQPQQQPQPQPQAPSYHPSVSPEQELAQSIQQMLQPQYTAQTHATQQLMTQQPTGRTQPPITAQPTGQPPASIMPQPTGPPVAPQPIGQTHAPMVPQPTGYTQMPMQPQQTGQQQSVPMQPQQTGQTQGAQIQPMIPQQTGAPSVAPQQQPGLQAPQSQPQQPFYAIPLAVPVTTNPAMVPLPLTTQTAYTALPPVSRAPSAAAARTPQRAPADMPTQTPARSRAAPSTRAQTHRGPRTAASQSLSIPHAESVSRRGAAESYLDRVEHDSRVQHMLKGAPARTINTERVPPSETDNGRSVTDKPLPDPRGTTVHGGRSRAGTQASHKTPSRRYSLMDGLHAHSHTQAQTVDGDRYPMFAKGPMGTSQQSSVGSVDPAGIPLPLSTMQTPATHMRQPPQSQYSRGPPAPSQANTMRSRVAGALRGDGDMESQDLFDIQEQQEGRSQAAQSIYPPTHGPQSQASRSQPPMSEMSTRTGQYQQQRPPRRGYAPTMPPLRPRPNVVMPQRLGAPGGGRPMSEHPHGPRRPDLGAMYGRDLAAHLTEQLPEPKSAYDVPNTHPEYVPPNMAPHAVSGGVEDIQGPRHSALGLEGIESRSQSIKAPTITVQPPSSRSKSNNVSQLPSTRSVPQTLPHAKTPANRVPIVLDSPVSHVPTDPPHVRPLTDASPARSRAPTELPPARSRAITEAPGRSRAPTEAATARSRVPTERGRSRAFTEVSQRAPSQAPTATADNRSKAPTAISKDTVYQAGLQPTDIPLPAPRSQAPTVYTGLSPESNRDRERGMRDSDARSVNIVDYALQKPLPDSRPTTYLGSGMVRAGPLPDVHSPAGTMRNYAPSRNGGASVRRKPVPDPYVRGPSRAATRRSTHAPTLATIEDMTEESAAEGRSGRY